jgi:hypothetical protein
MAIDKTRLSACVEIGTGAKFNAWVSLLVLRVEHANMVSLACQLEKELTDAKQQYLEKRDALGERCTQFDRELGQWMELSREPVVEGKRVTSVYKHDDSSSKLANPQSFVWCWR